MVPFGSDVQNCAMSPDRVSQILPSAAARRDARRRGADGAWVTYAQWSSRAAWEAAWKSGKPANPSATAAMRDCVETESVDEQFELTMSLEVADDLLRAVPFRAHID